MRRLLFVPGDAEGELEAGPPPSLPTCLCAVPSHLSVHLKAHVRCRQGGIEGMLRHYIPEVAGVREIVEEEAAQAPLSFKPQPVE